MPDMNDILLGVDQILDFESKVQPSMVTKGDFIEVKPPPRQGKFGLIHGFTKFKRVQFFFVSSKNSNVQDIK